MNDFNFSYNERLFSKGLRKKLHYSRFHWLSSSLKRLNCTPKQVLELGCFDAKTLNFLPVKPDRYVGLDANFEGGLDIARKIWVGKEYEFYECHNPGDIKITGLFDISICMETFEYIRPEFLEEFIKAMADRTRFYIFVTTSNQKGLLFIVKYILKFILRYKEQPYSFKDLFLTAIGKSHKIKREHRKGWDYKSLIFILSKYFSIKEISNYPIRHFPGLGVCIIGKKF